MLSCQNKKGGLEGFLGDTLIAILAFLLILGVISVFKAEAEPKSAEVICRTSVVLREKSYTEIEKGPVKLGSIASPLACRTLDKPIPENKDASREQVKQELANSMATCWKQFGEGKISDVFKEGDSMSKNCFICYNVNLRESSDFKAGKNEITSTDLRQYLFENPYIAYSNDDNCKINGGFCSDAETSNICGSEINADASYLLIDKKSDVCSQKNKKACCYTEYECWNRGGVCSGTNPDSNNYVIYSKWDCPSKMTCYIKKENFYSFGDYIQKYGGQGNLIITTPNIKPGETYAISFGSPTKECSWCTEAAKGASGGAAVGMAATILYVLSQGGAVATVTALIPGAGLVVVGGGVLLAAGGTYVLTKSGLEMTNEQIDKLLSERKLNTIYFTTLNEMVQGNHCSLIKDIKEK